MYYIHGVSVPSLVIESTDSMITSSFSVCINRNDQINLQFCPRAEELGYVGHDCA